MPFKSKLLPGKNNSVTVWLPESTLTGKRLVLARKGYDVQYGARPLKRALQTYLEDAICELVINDELQEGEILTVRAAEGDKLRITHGLAQE